MNFPSVPRTVVAALLISSLILGLAQAALLLPFEGFDEHAGRGPTWAGRKPAMVNQV